MEADKIGIGIVGLRPTQGWAAWAHLPALQRLSDHFEVRGVANSTMESAQAAVATHGIPTAFASVAEMVEAPEINLVVVTTRVPQHFEIIKMALAAGKPVYCEWPLGRTLAEANELASLAKQFSVPVFTGNQSRVSPAIQYITRLIRKGEIGEIVSTRIEGYVHSWGPVMTDRYEEEYLRQRNNGASLLTIPFGHMMAALRDALGNINDVSAVLATRYPRVQVANSDVIVSADAADHIIIAGTMVSGAPLSITYSGGTPPAGPGFIWDIRGTSGDLRITGNTGYVQVADLKVSMRKNPETDMQDLLTDTDHLSDLGPVAGNVARIYERIKDDLRLGTHSAPTFADAVGLHTVLEAIERAAEVGHRVSVESPNRALPF